MVFAFNTPAKNMKKMKIKSLTLIVMAQNDIQET